MTYKTAAPCALFREHVTLNPGSFSTSANADADFWRETANLEGLPARLTHVHDATAYGTQPTSDSWQVRLSGAGSNANANATNQGGQLT
jgi:hypothetical protein